MSLSTAVFTRLQFTRKETTHYLCMWKNTVSVSQNLQNSVLLLLFLPHKDLAKMLRLVCQYAIFNSARHYLQYILELYSML